jgi:hypothetical protein
MKLRKAILAFAISGLAASPALAVADEAPTATAQAPTAEAPKEAPKSIDERVSDLEKSLGALADFQLSGMFYTSYLWNFNDPDNRINSLRSLDNQDNTFGVDLFQLGITKKGPGGLSAKITLDVGNTASRIGADWKGNGQFTGVTGDNGDFEIEEVYANYAPDWSHGLSAKFGKFVTLLGAEVIEAPSNMNYSRSFLFSFAIPFTNTGLMFNYPFTDTLQTNLGVVNGWDNVADNNSGKTFMGNVAWAPNPNFSLAVAGIFGPEENNTSSHPRGVADVVSTITVDPVTISLNGDYGTEGDAAVNHPGATAEWYGFSGIVGATWKDLICLPIGTYFRGEVFRDQGGFRTGTDQTLWEVTATGKYFITDKLTVWLEYRHDGSDESVFTKSGTIVTTDPITGNTVTTFPTQDYQDTISIAASYVF